ncbi:zinc ribbon domain-containing protein [Halorussus pelagicus]|uniref:zinc ribbon domain-containing protein n=1 Tax=Halorussus pelagicus TaxID=2505977 RepID=UPI000FFC035A|nr:zinc ribbon domain-containing protein [Halorussus pelagicus]
MSPRTTPNFCSQCGASLSPGDSFCSQCGSAVDEETAGAQGVAPDTDAAALSDPGLRERVESLALDGWEVKRDDGDGVVMVNRTIGSLWIHALLLAVTTPAGNLLYAWYNYSPGAERIELRPDGTERRPDENSSEWTLKSAVGIAAGLLFGAWLAFVGTLALWLTSSFLTTLLAVVFLLGAVASIPLAMQFAPGFESPTTFGRRQTTDEEIVDEPNRPCSACARPVGTGVRRTFAEKRYVAGIPVETLSEGENIYCRACANGDPFVRERDDDETGPEREREFA